MAPSQGDNGREAVIIDRSKTGIGLPDFVFSDGKGADITLARFAGKPMLVNLWATWCAPCVAEMPQLDKIAGDYAASGLQVFTISQDSMGSEKVLPFFEEKGFRHLTPWLDPENQFGFRYANGVLPATILFDADGKEVTRVIGALDWEKEEGRALLKKVTGR